MGNQRVVLEMFLNPTHYYLIINNKVGFTQCVKGTHCGFAKKT